jgi:5-methylcytosine-specific restriction endonuclease McrA
MPQRRSIPLRVRRDVIRRAQGHCEYCRSPEAFSLDTFTIDHVHPVADSGSDEPNNLAFACHNCNNRKQDATSAVDPLTEERVPLYHPRHNRWSDHF